MMRKSTTTFASFAFLIPSRGAGPGPSTTSRRRRDRSPPVSPGARLAVERHAHEQVGEFWLSVARMVIDHMAQYAAPPVRRGPSTIQ